MPECFKLKGFLQKELSTNMLNFSVDKWIISYFLEKFELENIKK